MCENLKVTQFYPLILYTDCRKDYKHSVIENLDIVERHKIMLAYWKDSNHKPNTITLYRVQTQEAYYGYKEKFTRHKEN